MIQYEPVTLSPLSGAHVAQSRLLHGIAWEWGYDFGYLLADEEGDAEWMMEAGQEALAMGGTESAWKRAWKLVAERIEEERAYEEWELRMQAETEWSLRAGNV